MPGRMNQYPDAQQFAVTPDISPQALAATLAGLLVPGDITDNRLERYSAVLQDLYARFCSTCPAPAWAPGLVVTPEMRCQAEVYLPLAAILPTFRHLLRRCCRHEPFLPAAAIFSASSWYDALAAMQPLSRSTDPAELLGRLAADQRQREQFVAAALVPARFGNGFGRYGGQMEFLRHWLQERSAARVRILDAACGSGEQCYELAELLADLGMTGGESEIAGMTIEPLELAAAAHGWFPHDRRREAAFRSRLGPLFANGGTGMISFFQGDLCRMAGDDSRFTVVICNGLLGGPLLNDRTSLAATVTSLAARTEKGGLLLAADRFHPGWRKRVPLDDLASMIAAAGFSQLHCSDGLAAVRL